MSEQSIVILAWKPERERPNGSRSKKPWTLDEDNRLRISMAEGKAARTIADDSKRSTRARISLYTFDSSRFIDICNLQYSIRGLLSKTFKEIKETLL